MSKRSAAIHESPSDRLAAFTPVPIKPTVSLNVLASLDIRVGQIEGVEDVPGSSKLVALLVSFGDHRRRIVAGLKKERADPRELIGRQALFVVNLEPKRMAGILSEGMLFDIGYADGLVPVLACPEAPVPNGARAVEARRIHDRMERPEFYRYL